MRRDRFTTVRAVWSNFELSNDRELGVYRIVSLSVFVLERPFFIVGANTNQFYKFESEKISAISFEFNGAFPVFSVIFPEQGDFADANRGTKAYETCCCC